MFLLASISYAQSGKVAEVYFEHSTSEFLISTEKINGHSITIKSKNIILVSDRLSICHSGCLAEIKKISIDSFAVLVAGHKIAKVKTNDSDNIINNEAFEVTGAKGNERIIMNLNLLERDSRAEVR